MKLTRVNVSDQVVDWLVDSIQAGNYKPGEQLPPLDQLAKDLGVGRSSIREALRHMQALGYIELHQGKGTFVASRKVHLGSYGMSFTQSIYARGMKPSSVVLHREKLISDENIQEYLNLEDGEEVNLLQRLRLADGEPLAIENSYTPYRLFPDLLESQWNLDTSLYERLEQQYEMPPIYAHQTVTPALIEGQQSQLLQVPEGSLGLMMETVAYTAQDIPIEYAHSIYRGDRYAYTVTLHVRRKNEPKFYSIERKMATSRR